ncbi:hypothetical protein, partial [Gemmiger sp.]|uniref:hypothetical protein n=1 Tax=Gemmiger sp. TaxID=2049027 RepID=UPI0025BC826E
AAGAVLKPQGGNCAVLPYHNQNAEAITTATTGKPAVAVAFGALFHAVRRAFPFILIVSLILPL